MKTSAYLSFCCILFSCFLGISQGRTNKVSGMVTDGRIPLKSVKISVIGNDQKFETGADGKYVIEVPVGEILQYYYPGMRTIEIFVEDVTHVLNISMYPDIEELDEVVVTKSRRQSQQDLEVQYNTNPNLIRSAYGILNPETSASQIRMLPKGRIRSIGLCILDVLRAEFPGVEIFGDCINGGSVSIRGSNSLNLNALAIYDVDGQIFQNTPLWLSPDNMERIAVVSGFAANISYGGIASGGVVIINTNSGNTYAKSKEIKDKAKLRDNVLNEVVLTQNDLKGDMPQYYQDFYASSALETAKDIYRSYADRYNGNFVFFLDAYSYFNNKWKDHDFADGIIKSQESVFKENPIALKALAYEYQQAGKFEKANDIYKQLFLLRPNYAQSYMDLANSYIETGDYKKATALYVRFGYLKEEGFLQADTTAITRIMDREFNNLIATKGKELLSSTAMKKSVLEEDFDGTRLVFEWNDSEAEFKLQFVNPEGHYFTSEHSLIADADRIKKEKQYGFSCEEFLIDDTLSGNWMVNTTYLGNKSLTPTYLKVTVYQNYGSSAQRKITRVYKLRVKNVNQQLFTLNNGAFLASN